MTKKFDAFWWLWGALGAAWIAAMFASDPVHAADSYTTNLRIVQQVPGTNAATWGTKANAAFAMLDEAISKVTSISVTAGNITLTTANNATDQSRSAVLVFTGTPGASRTATAPNVQKTYYIYNNSDSTVTLGAGGGTTVAVAAATKTIVYADGATNAVSIYTGPVGTVVGTTDTQTLSNKTLSGNITLPGSGQLSSAGLLGLGMTPVNILDITKTQDAGSLISLKNASTGTGAFSAITLLNLTQGTALVHLGSSYTASGMNRQDGGKLESSGAGGLTLNTNANQPVYVGVNNADIAQFNSAGLTLASGKSINKIAVTAPATGATLTIADGTTLTYAECSWTPVDSSGAALTFTTVSSSCTRIGRMVFAYAQLTFPSTGSAVNVLIGGLPYTAANANYAKFGAPGVSTGGFAVFPFVVPNSTTFNIRDSGASLQNNSVYSTRTLNFMITYPTS